MNYNERELERASYDNWKLSDGGYKMNSKRHTFIKRELLGKCPCCDEKVFDNQLYVEESDNKVYHFSCHNEMKREEEEE